MKRFKRCAQVRSLLAVLAMAASVASGAASAQTAPRGVASAGDGARITVGLGLDRLRDRSGDAAGASILWASAPFGARGNWRWRLGGMISARQDYWIGGGISFEQRLGNGPWYVEAGYAPGVFSRADAPVGGKEVTAPSFLSHVAIGYRLGGGADVSVVLSHRSSGRLTSNGAISEELHLRFGVPF
jgi:hypothetical protein